MPGQHDRISFISEAKPEEATSSLKRLDGISKFKSSDTDLNNKLADLLYDPNVNYVVGKLEVKTVESTNVSLSGTSYTPVSTTVTGSYTHFVNIQGIDEETGQPIISDTSVTGRTSLSDTKPGTLQSLIGLEVITSVGDTIGKISEILSIASADVYVINGNGGEILIPATDEIIKSIDLDKGVMVIEPMAGLLDLNEKKRKK